MLKMKWFQRSTIFLRHQLINRQIMLVRLWEGDRGWRGEDCGGGIHCQTTLSETSKAGGNAARVTARECSNVERRVEA